MTSHPSAISSTPQNKVSIELTPSSPYPEIGDLPRGTLFLKLDDTEIYMALAYALGSCKAVHVQLKSGERYWVSEGKKQYVFPLPLGSRVTIEQGDLKCPSLATPLSF